MYYILSSILPGIRGLHCKIAASSVLYANEKNIYYDPDYISGLSRALVRFFPTTFFEIVTIMTSQVKYIIKINNTHLS